MAVFKGSRFDGSTTYNDSQNRIVYLDVIRLPKFTADKDDLVIDVQQGQRLDMIAFELYGDSQLEWVLMDANPQYLTPLDVQPGDRINAPLPEKVIKRA
jgi:hypothetical protein